MPQGMMNEIEERAKARNLVWKKNTPKPVTKANEHSEAQTMETKTTESDSNDEIEENNNNQ